MPKEKEHQLTQYCSIHQWLEQHHPEFIAAMRDNCIDRKLNPGTNGVTLLFPNEAAYRDDIISKVYSNPDDASNMFLSLIIPLPLVSEKSFTEQEIGNCLGVKLEVESVAKDLIKLKGGVELSIVPEFKPRTRQANNIAVWYVTKGRLPLTGDKYEIKYKKMGKKTGGAAIESPKISRREILMNRLAYAFSYSGSYHEFLASNGRKVSNIYVHMVLSLMKFLSKKNEPIYKIALAKMDYNAFVSAYLLIEPHKTEGHLIPDYILFGDGGWNFSKCHTEDANTEYLNLLSRKNLGTDATPPEDLRKKILADIDELRASIIQVNNIGEIYTTIKNKYEVLIETNAIGNSSPVFSNDVLEHYKKDKNPAQKLMWEHEFRFLYGSKFNSLCNNFDFGEFNTLIQSIKLHLPGNDYANEIGIVVAKQSNDINRRIHMQILMKFVNSSAFLYTVEPLESVDESRGMIVNGTMDDLDSLVVYNINRNEVKMIRSMTTIVHRSNISLGDADAVVAKYVEEHNGLLPDLVTKALLNFSKK